MAMVTAARAGSRRRPSLARLRRALPGLSASNRRLVLSSSSLVSTTGVTSILGVGYWWLAARMFPASAVGFAGAAVSAMTLIGSFSMLGLGTLLMGELSRQPGRRRSLLTTALAGSCLVGLIFGLLAAAAGPHVSSDLAPMASSISVVITFGLGVGLFAMTKVLDQALIGLSLGGLQLWRNIFFGVIKLGALALPVLWWKDNPGMVIYSTWVIGSILSLAAIAWMSGGLRGGQLADYRPQPQLLRELRAAALGHHALNLALQAPMLALPLLVTALLSDELNAGFYIAWMISSFLFVVPSSLAIVLYAAGAAEPDALAQKLRLTLSLSIAFTVIASIGLVLVANPVLQIFGAAYARNATSTLRVLALAAFPLIIRTHFIAISRASDRVNKAIVVFTVGGCLEILLAALGGTVAGLDGVALGWAIALCLEAVYMGPPVLRLAFPPNGWLAAARGVGAGLRNVRGNNRHP